MAKVRIGYGTDFSLENELVGIGTDTPTKYNLDLRNNSSNLLNDYYNVGVATIGSSSGFLNNKQTLSTHSIDNLSVGSISDEIIIDGEVTVSSGSTIVSGVETLTVTDNFTLPGINDDKPTVGTTRFNENLGALEFYTGVEWRAVNFRIDMGNSGRGLFAGGYGPYLSGSNYGAKNIEYINIATQGNSHRFGDLVDGQGLNDAASSSTRMVVSGGYNSSFGGGNVEDIQYVTMASEGNAIDFGNQTNATYGTGACSSSTRALIMGGNRMPASSPYDDGNDGSNVICYIEIATTGDALDFGDMVQRRAYPGSCGSSVRAVIFGGYANEIGAGGISSIETVNYGSKGNGIDFGDLVEAGSNKSKSNSVKAIIAGTSGGSGTYTSVIQSVSIQTLGNAVYFGDRSVGEGNGNACSSQTRAVFAGGRTLAAPSTGHKNIDYVEFASTGNSISFGDLGYLAAEAAGSSDCHGGLGGF